jgi:C4-dicarboxylate-specific signal transduction histidine kinase
MSTPAGGKRAHKGHFLAAGGFALVIAAAFAAYHIVYRLQADDISRVVAERVSLYEATIRQTIDRFSYLPLILSNDPRVTALLQSTDDQVHVSSANTLLQQAGDKSGAAALYVMDASGLTVAASNWNQPLTFVGNNYSFRPYFTGAMQHGTGQFYGVGVTTGEPGFFISARVGPAERPLGVATVKISLAALEKEWQAANEAVLLADDNGVVFLSSRRGWVYRPLLPLSPGALEHATATHQYGAADLTRRPLMATGSVLGDGRVMVHDDNGIPKPHAVGQKRLAGFGWTIAVLHDFDAAARMAGQAAALAGLAFCVVFLAGVVLAQRRATVRAKLRAHDELERRVRERTSELVLANERLASEVEQRISAEAHLRQTQDELIQAGKLAALGHMSAALSHEINQPLTALRTYISSTARLAGQGNIEAVQGNIGRMEQLISRMADITSHLKRFARVEAGPAGTAQIGAVLDNALALIAPRIEAEDVTVHREGEADLAVQGSENRLEQVFVNLIGNALDAVAAAGRREVVIRVSRALSGVAVEVEDSGHGVPVEHHGLIFAPYFTTKEVGSGLGLGLSISHTIVTSFGGTLTVRPAPSGGALFTVHLKAAKARQSPLEAAE